MFIHETFNRAPTFINLPHTVQLADVCTVHCSLQLDNTAYQLTAAVGLHRARQ